MLRFGNRYGDVIALIAIIRKRVGVIHSNSLPGRSQHAHVKIERISEFLKIPQEQY